MDYIKFLILMTIYTVLVFLLTKLGFYIADAIICLILELI